MTVHTEEPTATYSSQASTIDGIDATSLAVVTAVVWILQESLNEYDSKKLVDEILTSSLLNSKEPTGNNTICGGNDISAADTGLINLLLNYLCTAAEQHENGEAKIVCSQPQNEKTEGIVEALSNYENFDNLVGKKVDKLTTETDLPNENPIVGVEKDKLEVEELKLSERCLYDGCKLQEIPFVEDPIFLVQQHPILHEKRPCASLHDFQLAIKTQCCLHKAQAIQEYQALKHLEVLMDRVEKLCLGCPLSAECCPQKNWNGAEAVSSSHSQYEICPPPTDTTTTNVVCRHSDVKYNCEYQRVCNTHPFPFTSDKPLRSYSGSTEPPSVTKNDFLIKQQPWIENEGRLSRIIAATSHKRSANGFLHPQAKVPKRDVRNVISPKRSRDSSVESILTYVGSSPRINNIDRATQCHQHPVIINSEVNKINVKDINNSNPYTALSDVYDSIPRDVYDSIPIISSNASIHHYIDDPLISDVKTLGEGQDSMNGCLFLASNGNLNMEMSYGRTNKSITTKTKESPKCSTKPSKRTHKTDKAVANTTHQCATCLNNVTPQWRYMNSNRLCNACYMRLKRHLGHTMRTKVSTIDGQQNHSLEPLSKLRVTMPVQRCHPNDTYQNLKVLHYPRPKTTFLLAVV